MKLYIFRVSFALDAISEYEALNRLTMHLNYEKEDLELLTNKPELTYEGAINHATN